MAGFTLTDERKKELEKHCLTIVNALGYEFNTIEFAVRDNIPYAIDFLNPAPDAEKSSVQEENFEWVLVNAAKFLVELALEGRKTPTEYTWSEFLSGNGSVESTVTTKKETKKSSKKK